MSVIDTTFIICPCEMNYPGRASMRSLLIMRATHVLRCVGQLILKLRLAAVREQHEILLTLRDLAQLWGELEEAGLKPFAAVVGGWLH
ncbi:hypothetical protein DAEQUDRAFT_733532 [Daedalea quercina L-15889]|uniref:Uncharacterized protein n=1 Tax=Daedalea quercina L-15889 TaxID=1314783 RepID=A0A165KX43_9APHY|nr:hypothetical protein DAEQUDRAFT_733532 [Daedalea quercina L-15889]